MKTFSELSIGDIIYRIKKNGSLLENKDSYGNKYAADLLYEIKIKNLTLQESGCIWVNKSSYDGRSCDVSIAHEHMDKPVIDSKDYIYFVDPENYKIFVSEFIIDKIKEEEKRIVDVKKSAEKTIGDLRVAYYDFLNNTGFILKNPDL